MLSQEKRKGNVTIFPSFPATLDIFKSGFQEAYHVSCQTPTNKRLSFIFFHSKYSSLAIQLLGKQRRRTVTLCVYIYFSCSSLCMCIFFNDVLDVGCYLLFFITYLLFIWVFVYFTVLIYVLLSYPCLTVLFLFFIYVLCCCIIYVLKSYLHLSYVFFCLIYVLLSCVCLI